MKAIWKFLTCVIAICLALVMTLCSLGCIYIAATQPILKQEALNGYMDQMDLSQIANVLKLDDDNILSSILGRLMESEAVEDVVEDYLSGYVLYLLRGGADWHCTDAQVSALAAAAVDIASDVSNGLTDILGSLAQSGFELAVRAAMTQVPAYSQINLGIDKDALKLVQNLLSEDMLIVFAFLMAAIFLLIALIRWSIRESLLFSGLGVGLAGLAAVVISFLAREKAVSLFAATPLKAMIVPMTGDYFKAAMINGACSAAIALVCLLIYSSWTRKRRAHADDRKKSRAA